MSTAWPDHLLTLAEWEALPEDEAFRLEVGEGVLSIMPKPLSWHRKAATRLGYRLDGELPTELTSLNDVEVVLADDFLTIRVPDVVVTATARCEQNPPRFRASEILVAVEILSDGSRRIDRVLKFSEYAEAGIPQYWIVDIAEPTTLLAYTLVDGTYELSAEVSGRATLEVAGHLVELDLDALARR